MFTSSCGHVRRPRLLALLPCDFQSSRLFPTSAVPPKTAARKAGSRLRSKSQAVQSGTAGGMAPTRHSGPTVLELASMLLVDGALFLCHTSIDIRWEWHGNLIRLPISFQRL